MDVIPPQHSRTSVARNAGIISLAVMASRILGLVRDQVFAAFFGAGLLYDAFLTAFRIPNLLRDLFAEGALSAAFVTTFTLSAGSSHRPLSICSRPVFSRYPARRI
jgi:putative peptidoglycan lipid II flippase